MKEINKIDIMKQSKRKKGDIVEISLRLSDINAGEKGINTDVSSNDGQNMIKTSNKIVTIKVKDSSSNGNNDSNNGATTKPIPQTGDNHYFIIVGIICMIAISTIAYSKFTKYDK